MARKNTNIRPYRNSVHPGLVSETTPCELSVEGELAGKGKVWIASAAGNPASWTSLDRTAYLAKHTKVTPVSTFFNSWTNYGSAYLSAAWYLDSVAVLWLQGSLTAGTVGADAFQLPAGCFDPAYRYCFPVLCINGSTPVIGRLDILKTGRVMPQSGYNTRFALDGIKLPIGASWTGASLNTGWVGYGGEYTPASFYLDPDGVVHLRGLVRYTGGSGAGSIICTLPAGCRPANRLLFAALSHDGSNILTARIDVDTSGNVVFMASNAAGWLTLDGIAFPDASVSPRAVLKVNDWTRYNSTYADAQYFRIRDSVFLQGLLKNGPGSFSYLIALPEASVYSQVEPLCEKTIRARDFLETFEAGNYSRINIRSLSYVSWTDLPPGASAQIRKVHMDNLRALSTGIVNYGGGDFTFTDPVITAGLTAIRSAHLEEVRQTIDDAGMFARCYGCHSFCGESCSAQCAASCNISCHYSCSGYCQSGCAASCQDSCSQNCYTSCSSGCFAGCSGTCTRNNCAADSCGTGCTQSCHASCSWTCVGGFIVPQGFCSGDCWGACTLKCYGACTGSCGAADCTGQCNATCYNNCYNACSSCAYTCEAACSSSCSAYCYADCSSECGNNCTQLCYQDCATICVGNCFNSCLAGCYSSCADTARIGADPGGLP